MAKSTQQTQKGQGTKGFIHFFPFLSTTGEGRAAGCVTWEQGRDWKCPLLPVLLSLFFFWMERAFPAPIHVCPDSSIPFPDPNTQAHCRGSAVLPMRWLCPLNKFPDGHRVLAVLQSPGLPSPQAPSLIILPLPIKIPCISSPKDVKVKLRLTSALIVPWLFISLFPIFQTSPEEPPTLPPNLGIQSPELEGHNRDIPNPKRKTRGSKLLTSSWINTAAPATGASAKEGEEKKTWSTAQGGQ